MYRINIYLSDAPYDCLGYRDVKSKLEEPSDDFEYVVINTTCSEFFSHDYVEHAVFVYDKDSYISLSELVEDCHQYTDKEICPAHNLRKLLIGGCFKFKPLVSPFDDEGYMNEQIEKHNVEIEYVGDEVTVYANGCQSGLICDKEDIPSAVAKVVEEKTRFDLIVSQFEKLFEDELKYLPDDKEELIFQGFLAGRNAPKI